MITDCFIFHAYTLTRCTILKRGDGGQLIITDGSHCRELEVSVTRDQGQHSTRSDQCR